MDVEGKVCEHGKRSVRLRRSLHFANRVCANAHMVDFGDKNQTQNIPLICMRDSSLFMLDFESELEGESANFLV